MFAQYQLDTQMKKALEDGGWGEVDEFRNSNMELYRERNKAKLIEWKPNEMSEEEKVAFSRQLEPIEVDPNAVADMRQRMTQIDAMLKKINPRLSVFNHPDTRETAHWLNRESTPYMAGYISSGEQPYDYGAGAKEKMPWLPEFAAQGLGRYAAMGEAIESGVTGLSYGLVRGGSALALMGLDSITGGRGEDYWNIPTSSMVEQTGEVVHNGGKVHPEAGLLLQIQNKLLGNDFEAEAIRLEKAREWEESQRKGFTWLTLGMAHLAGSFVGFGPAGKAWQAGSKLGLKGAQMLAGGGKKLGRMTEIVAKTTGAAIAGGTVDGIAFGRHEGFGKAFAHGVVVTPLYLALGAMGRGSERWLKQKKMPKKIAQTIAGGFEGMGLGALEYHNLSPLWRFMQDPNERDWGEFGMVMLKNILTLAAMKGAGRGHGTPSEMAEQTGMVSQLERAIVDVAKEAHETVDPARREEILTAGEAEGWSRADILELGSMSSAQKVSRGTSPEKSRELREQIGELKGEATRRKMGMAEPKVKEVEREYEQREAIEQLRRAGTRLRERGQLEGRLEQQGRQVPQETGLRDPISRLQRGTQERDIPGREKTEIGMATAGGEAVPIRGARGAREVTVEQMREAAEKLGKDVKDVSTIHTHPTPEPASIADLGEMAHKLGKGKESAPDYIVTPEAVYEVRVSGERTKPITLGDKPKAKERRERLLKAGAQRIAKDLGVRLSEVKAARKKWLNREPLNPTEKKIARQLLELTERVSEGVARELGLTIKRVSAAEASKALRFGQEAPAAEGVPSRLGEGQPTGRGEPGLREASGLAMAEDKPRTMAEILSNRNFPAEGMPEAREAVEGVEPIRVSDLKREMEGRSPRKGVLGVFGREGDPVRTPMRAKGFRRSGIMGYFETRQDIIRSQEAYDLNNMAHEWAHAMQSKMVGFDWRPSSTQAMTELMELATPMVSKNMNTRQKVAEGWAEFWSRELLGDPQLQAEFPTLYKELTGWMADPAQRPLAQQYRRIRDAYERWRLQGAVARAKGEIEPRKGTRKSEAARAAEEGPVEKVEAFMGKLVDDAATFKRAYDKWMKIAGQDPAAVPITYQPAKLYDALRMTAPRVAEQMLNIGMTDLAGRKTGQSMKETLGDLKSEELENFWAYMKRRRELEMMDQGLTTGVSREEALYVVQALSNPKFERIANDMRDWFHGLIDYVAESGGLSIGQTEAIKDAYMVYIPFQRMFDQVPARKQGRGVAEQGTGLKTMKGGTQPILDPLVAIQEMTTSLVVRAQKAMVMRALHDHHLLVEGQGGFVTDVTRKVQARDVALKDVADALEQQERPGDEQHEAESAATILRQLAEGDYSSLTIFTQATTPTGKEPVVAHTVNYSPEQMHRLVEVKAQMLRSQNLTDAEVQRRLKQFKADVAASQGKLKWLELDVDAYELMMGIDASPIWLDRLPTVMRVALTAPAKAVRMGATIFNLPFIIRNIVRDAKQQGMYSKHGSWLPLSGFVEMLRGMKLRGTEEAALFEALGGKGTTFIGQEVTGPALEKGQSFFSQEKTPLEVIKTAANRIADFIGASEQWLRRREFQQTRTQALAEGKTELEANLEALLDAKEVTVNFTRGSAFSRAMNQIFPYFNSGAQGSRKFVRHVAGYEGEKARNQAIIHGLTHLTSMSALVYLFHGDEEWYRDLPEWRRRNYWNFKLFGDDEIVSLPKPFQAGALFTVPFEMMLDAMTQAEQPLSVKEGLLDFVGQFLNGYQVLPALIQPAAEVTANYSTFGDRPIVPTWMDRSRMPKDQFSAYTTHTARWLGELFNVSPMKIEHLISGYSGGALLDIMRTLDFANNARETEVPVVGSFVKQKEHKQSRWVKDLYDLDREISQARGSDELSSLHKGFRDRVRKAKDRINALKKSSESGKIEARVANRRSYEIARQLMRQYEKAKR